MKSSPDNKTPFSHFYDDFYFSKQGVIEESTYIYLEGAGVKEAMKQKKSPITIAEIGFGYGINLLLALKQFCEINSQTQTPPQRIHYISVEKHPIAISELENFHATFPELLPFSKQLLNQYPILTPGIHRLSFFNGIFILDLVIGDALEQFKELNFKANHWYWDGFAPSKNPDAFSEELFQEIARLSAPGAKGASYTASGWVRRSIEKSGFQITKRPGFGLKRECITAELLNRENESKPSKTPWFTSEKLPKLKPRQKIAVVGAGLAGSAMARTFADRGFEVTVFDQNGIAGRASSNSIGLFDVQLSKIPSPLSRFAQASFTHFTRELKKLKLPHRLGIQKKELDALVSLQNSRYPESFYSVDNDSIFYQSCGLVNPSTLCEARLDHPLISFVAREILNPAELLEFDHIVYALGADFTLKMTSLQHPLLTELPLRAIRGQTLLVKPSNTSQNLPHARVEEGYVSPIARDITGHDFHLIGATYQAKNIADDQEELDTLALINEAKSKWPEFNGLSRADVVSSKVGFRLSTPDKLPLIGPLCDPEYLKINYAHALRGSHHKPIPSLEIPKSEWLFMGFGSRGITFSSLGAEILISMMLGFPLPIEENLVPHLHPARFFIRNLKRPEVK